MDGRIVRNVAILGLVSTNRSQGVTRRYAREGVMAAAPKYEGVHVLLDHQPGRESARSVRDLAAVIQQPRFDDETERLRGDLNCLPGPEGDKLLSIAQSGLHVGGLSHVAEGKFSPTQKGLVESINRVINVAYVLNPATTRSLAEGGDDDDDPNRDGDGEMVDWEKLTLDELRKNRPDLVASLGKDAETATQLAAVKADLEVARTAQAAAESQLHAGRLKGALIVEARKAGFAQSQVNRVLQIAEGRGFDAEKCKDLVEAEKKYLQDLGVKLDGEKKTSSVEGNGPDTTDPSDDGLYAACADEAFFEGLGIEIKQEAAKA